MNFLPRFGILIGGIFLSTLFLFLDIIFMQWFLSKIPNIPDWKIIFQIIFNVANIFLFGGLIISPALIAIRVWFSFGKYDDK